MKRKEAKRPRIAQKRDMNDAPAGNKGSAGAFRWPALEAIARASMLLSTGLGSPSDAYWAAFNDKPDVALRRIARAEAELRRAKKALQFWRDGR